MKMNSRSAWAGFVAMALLLPAMAMAQDVPPATNQSEPEPSTSFLPDGFSVTLTGVSDYVFLGISQTGGEPAIQGSIDWTHDSGFYLGSWASNVDFEDNSNVKREFDFYGGYRHDFGKLSTDWSLLQVAYSAPKPGFDYNYSEAKLMLKYPLDERFTLNSEYRYSPDYSGDAGDEHYIGAGVDVALPYEIGFSTGIGYQWIEKNANYGYPDYANWRAGFTYPLEGFNLGLTYTDTNISENDCPNNCDGRVIFSVSRTF